MHSSQRLLLQVDAFLHILDVACGPEVEQHFYDSKFERLQVYCAAASYHLSKAQMSEERAVRNEALAKATSHLNKAMTIDVNEQLPLLGLGQVAKAKVSPHLQPIKSVQLIIVASLPEDAQ